MVIGHFGTFPPWIVDLFERPLLALLRASGRRLALFLGRDGEAIYGGKGVWRRRRWRSVRGELDPCFRGLHYCRRSPRRHRVKPVAKREERV